MSKNSSHFFEMSAGSLPPLFDGTKSTPNLSLKDNKPPKPIKG